MAYRTVGSNPCLFYFSAPILFLILFFPQSLRFSHTGLDFGFSDLQALFLTSGHLNLLSQLLGMNFLPRQAS